MPLTDAEIRAAKPKEKTYKLFDGSGLFLEVVPAGGKRWRLKYRFRGKEKLLSLGVYPDVSLAGRQDKQNNIWIEGARDKRDAARRLLATAIDPSEHRKALKHADTMLVENSFEKIAREWMMQEGKRWTPSYGHKVLRLLERDVFPKLGTKPISEVSAPLLLDVFRSIEQRGAGDTAHRARQICGQMFRYAIATGRAERDPAADLKGALIPVRTSHFSAIIEPEAIGGLLRAIDAYKGHVVTRAALKLAPLVFVRPNELRNARWVEIDLDKAEWTIPAERMKMRLAHLVPLSTQAIAILRELHDYTGKSPFLFPSPRTNTRPMSDNGILSALRRMGYEKEEMSGHGFRAMARTVLDEVLGVRPDYIEHQLAHAVRDPLGRAYNRTSHLPERRKMMQQWADYLDSLKSRCDLQTSPVNV